VSRTKKPGKRDRYTRTLKTPPLDAGGAVRHRHHHGSTERILRRNRKTWTRLGNKRRRRLDRAVIDRDSDGNARE
jgi:hypothetical protein